MEHESDDYISCNWCSWYSHQSINKETGRLGNKRTRGDHLFYYIIENGQNTEKCPGDLRRLVVTQTSMKNYQGVNKNDNNRINNNKSLEF